MREDIIRTSVPGIVYAFGVPPFVQSVVCSFMQYDIPLLKLNAIYDNDFHYQLDNSNNRFSSKESQLFPE
ncbi:SIS domain protein [Bacillus sp. FW1]|nr:SIS domain protein [Bacillus sp. FW1]